MIISYNYVYTFYNTYPRTRKICSGYGGWISSNWSRYSALGHQILCQRAGRAKSFTCCTGNDFDWWPRWSHCFKGQLYDESQHHPPPPLAVAFSCSNLGRTDDRRSHWGVHRLPWPRLTDLGYEPSRRGYRGHLGWWSSNRPSEPQSLSSGTLCPSVAAPALWPEPKSVRKHTTAVWGLFLFFYLVFRFLVRFKYFKGSSVIIGVCL